ncbi:MAG TPA: porin family protein [Longimicrobiaceae bacterium]|nr:porin family protein [Longimicrobiaceae bacterium]
MLRIDRPKRTSLTLLALAFLLLFAQSAHAQVREAGLKVGGGNSSMLFFFGPCPPEVGRGCAESAQPNQPRRGVAAGAFVRFGLRRGLSVQPELLYAQKGYEVTGPTLHLSYVELPFLFRADLRAPEARGLRPFLYGGPAPAVLVSCTVFGTTVQGPYRDRCGEADATPTGTDPAAYDLGLVLGGGLGYGRFALEVRHTRSLIDIGAWKGAEKSTNRALTVLLGYGVPVVW